MKFVALLAAVASLAITATAAARPGAVPAGSKPCRITMVRWDKVADATGSRFWQMWSPASCGLSQPEFAWMFVAGNRLNILTGTDYHRFARLPYVNGLDVTLVVRPQGGGPTTACSFIVWPAAFLRMAIKNCP